MRLDNDNGNNELFEGFEEDSDKNVTGVYTAGL